MRGKFVKTEVRRQEQGGSNGNPVQRNKHQQNGYHPSQQQSNASPPTAPLNNSRGQQGVPVHSERLHNQSRSTSSVALSDMSQLRERLKNIHHFYKSRIDEQKNRTSQRNEVFLVMVEEMQRSHVQKVEELRKLVQETQGDKKDVGLVDERMTDIQGSIDEILKQSADLKTQNEQLEGEIGEKEQVNKQKEEDLNRLREQLLQARNELQGFERLNLRENKRNKQILVMIQKISEAK